MRETIVGRLRTSRSHSCVPLFIAIYDLHKRPSRLVLVGALIANLICLLNRVQQPQFDLCKHLKAISMRLTTTAKKVISMSCIWLDINGEAQKIRFQNLMGFLKGFASLILSRFARCLIWVYNLSMFA